MRLLPSILTCVPSESLKYDPHPWSYLPTTKDGRSSTHPCMLYLETPLYNVYKEFFPPVMMTVGLVRSAMEQA